MSEQDYPPTTSDQKTYMDLLRDKREAHLKHYRESQRVKNAVPKYFSSSSASDANQKTHSQLIQAKLAAHVKDSREFQQVSNAAPTSVSTYSESDVNQKTYSQLQKEKHERHLQQFRENNRLKAEKVQEKIRIEAEHAQEQIRLAEEQDRLKAENFSRRKEAFERILRIHADQELSLSFDQFRTEYPKLAISSSTEDDCRRMWDNLILFFSWYQPEHLCDASAFEPILKRHIEAQRQQAEAQRLAERIEATMNSSVEKHALALHAKRRQLVYKNDYGVLKGEDKWHRELEEFITDMLSSGGISLFGVNIQAIIQSVNQRLDERAVVPQECASIAEMSGVEFEIHCANVLESAGWEVVRNGKVGDQGVDLIASKFSYRVAVQCKRYTGSVSNKAVQEVFAGMAYYKCSRGIVVSNASFTASAIRLARTNDILLMDPESLTELDHLLLN